MKRISVWATLLCLAAVATLALAAVPAQAVIGGQHDPGDKYPNVGVSRFEDESGGGIFGSCTLVGEDVVVTAVHVAWDAYNWDDPSTMAPGIRGWVSFDPDAVPWNRENGALWIELERVDLPPTFEWPPATNISMKANLGPGFEDVAIAKLSTAVTDIEPATVPDESGLGAMDLKRATLAMAGYGITGIFRGSLISWRDPRLQILFDGRNYKESIRLLSDNWLYADRFLMVSSCAAPGDSGGPLFYGTTVIGETTWGNGWTGDTPSYYYRLDTPASQALLAEWLPSSSFVTLH